MYTVVPGTDLEFLLWKSFRHPSIDPVYIFKKQTHSTCHALQTTPNVENKPMHQHLAKLLGTRVRSSLNGK